MSKTLPDRSHLFAAAFLLSASFINTSHALDDESSSPTWDVATPHYSVDAQTITLNVSEGTWMNLDVSPDCRHIAFDMLCDIYQLPISGGKAEPLLGGHSWEIKPQYSPDGRFLAFTSDRNGADNIWVMDLDNHGNKQQITHETFRLLNNPNWHPSGNYLVAKKHFTCLLYTSPSPRD